MFRPKNAARRQKLKHVLSCTPYLADSADYATRSQGFNMDLFLSPNCVSHLNQHIAKGPQTYN